MYQYLIHIRHNTETITEKASVENKMKECIPINTIYPEKMMDVLKESEYF